MHPLLALITAGLVSLHQYIPLDNKEYIRYFETANEITLEDIFPSANQTCLYLNSVFITTGLENSIGISSDNAFGKTLTQQLKSEEVLQSALELILSEPYSTKLKEFDLNPKTLSSFLKKICKKHFSILDFNQTEKIEVLNFIQTEIDILSKEDLRSFGLVKNFSSFPIIDRNNESFGTLYSESRRWINSKELSNHLILSLIATEDQNFFSHNGVDPSSLARIAKNLFSNSNLTGGSTITMQLLKNIYFNHSPSKIDLFNQHSFLLSALRKVREFYWAFPFEKNLYQNNSKLSGKQQVLEYYFNLLNLGPNITGINQASEVYFSKKPKNLSLAESAYITALLKGPYRYSNPSNYSKYTKPRRDNYIFEQVVKICSEVYNSQFKKTNKEIQKFLKNLCKDGNQKIDFQYINLEKQTKLPSWTQTQTPLTKPVFLPIQRQIKQFVDKQEFKVPFKEAVIQTTIDKKLQEIVFETVKEYLDIYDEELNSLNRVYPAKDDRGRKAQISSQDIHWTLNSEIKGFLSFFKEEKTKLLYSIRLNKQNNFSSNSLNVQAVRDFLSLFNSENHAQIDRQTQLIQSELLEKSKNIGEILFVKLKPNSFSIFTLNEMIESIEENLSSENIKSFKKLMSTQNLKNKIYKTALSRMYKLKQREYLEPALYIEGTLLNKDLTQIFLSDESKTHLEQTSSYQSGDFFWVKEQKPENINQQPIYDLQTEKLQAAVLVINSHSGEILASFEGYNPQNSFFYRSSQSKRHTGSLLKPWTYLYSLDRKDFQLQTQLNNNYASLFISKKNSYTPKNFSDRHSGEISLSRGFITSQNIATINLLQDPLWGLNWKDNLTELIQFFKQVNIYQKPDSADLHPSFLLGAMGNSLDRLVESFSFFSNGLYIPKLHLIKKIYNYKETSLYRNNLFRKVPVLYQPHSLFQIQTLMLQTANTGTARSLNSFIYNLNEGKYQSSCYNQLLKENHQSCLGGKTGTSNDGKDLWFIGFSKNFLIGIWLGYDSPKSIDSTSSEKAIPIFQAIIERGLEYLPPLEPILTPEEAPPNLEKRVVYGNNSCLNPIKDKETAYIIYPEKSSPNIKCITEQDNCICKNEIRIERDSKGNIVLQEQGYSLDILYKGVLYPNRKFYRSFEECLKGKLNFISKETKEKICN